MLAIPAGMKLNSNQGLYLQFITCQAILLDSSLLLLSFSRPVGDTQFNLMLSQYM